MNWDAIGAIAETLGAVGVIASLVYLATQIRHGQEQMSQNTRALQAGTYLEWQSHVDDSINRHIGNPENRRAIRLGMADYRQLGEDDEYLFRFWITSILHTYANALYQHRVGLFEDDRWQEQLLGLSAMLRAPGVVQWWNADGKLTFGSEFVALVEEILAEEPDRGEE